ncbi:poly polymerase and DNA-ligase Zn-finger region-domain-containing protein [Lipomyces arxii]|uniref:poly polymerase and DNA-ligase Zn-finger region-domain-containing protein n=1 Tax=Lipomyces arxii TaxID=56418 RepID=UPI0034CDB731
MAYRVEVAKKGHAGCRGSACKKEGIKIGNGELRLGVFVTISDGVPGWFWRHWKCVTPQVMENIKESLENGDITELDGFSEIPEEQQQIVVDSYRIATEPKFELPPEEPEEEEDKEQMNEDSIPVFTEATAGPARRGRKKGSKNKKRPAEDEEEDENEEQISNEELSNSIDDVTPLKRGRGRPKKNTDARPETVARRGRGRPKKRSVTLKSDGAITEPSSSAAAESSDDAPSEANVEPNDSHLLDSTSVAENGAPIKRGRGRPRKADTVNAVKTPASKKAVNSLPLPSGQKRPRGRPRKVALHEPEETPI